MEGLQEELTTQEKVSGQRVMQVFDFEERDVHFEPIPMYWSKVVSESLREMGYEEGFPHYSNGGFDSTFRHSGDYSFQLRPDGGSVGFAYDRRRLRAKAGSDFHVTGYVHLEQGGNCRAQLSCALTDRVGQIIPGSMRKSQLVGELDHKPDGWAVMEAYIPGNFPDARYITVGVWVLQEQQWNKEDRREQGIFQKNIDVKAWFDDIAIYQLPRVILRTDRPSNIFNNDEEAHLEVEVEGVGSLSYHVNLSVQSESGKEILRKNWVLTGMEGETKVRTIPLGPLPAQRYMARLEIMTMQKLIATRTITFARMGTIIQESTWSGKGFGIILMDEGNTEWSTQMELIRNSNSKLLKLPVWHKKKEPTIKLSSEVEFDEKLISLQTQKIRVVATFFEVPDEIALKMDISQRGLLDVLSQDVKLWRPQVAFTLARYAQQVPFWQIGGDFHTEQVWDPRTRMVVDTMRGEFNKLVSETILAVPLNCMFAVHQRQIGTPYVALGIPPAVPPEQIPAYLKDCQNRGLDNIWVTVEPINNQIFNWEQVLIDFAKRIAFSKKGLAESIFIEHPWEERYSNGRIITEPSELFLVFRTLSDQLGLTRYVGEFEIAPGIPALIFDRDGEGTIFTWNQDYDPLKSQEPPEIQLYLGESPEIVDLFGNRKKLVNQNGRSRLKLDHWPVFLSNVDTRIARLRSTLRLEPDEIDGSISRQKLKLKFINPFNTTISGSARFILDDRRHKNWLVEPLSFNYVLDAGQSFERNITIKLPSNELGGPKTLNVFIGVDADRNYNLRTAVPFEIKLTGIEVNIFTRLLNDSDLLIQQVVTNESENEISLNSFMDTPDQDHVEKAIPRLQPGNTVTKNYLIDNAEKWLGKIIRVGLYDPKGTKRINYHIEVN